MATDSCYYKLSLTNKDIEDNNTSQKSSASDLTIVLEKELNLLDSIFMKAMATEISIEMMNISSLPCTFSGSESLHLTLQENPSTCNGNAVVTESSIQRRNKIACSIPMHDTISVSPHESINYVNGLIEGYANKFILFRLMERLCDNKLFKDELMRSSNDDLEFTNDDVSVLVWYIETAVLTRLQLVASINVLTGDEDTPIDRPARKDYPRLTLADLTKVEKDSSLFCNPAERPEVEHKLMKLETFYDTSLSDVTDLLPRLDKDIKEYLKRQNFLVYEQDATTVTDESKTVLRTIRNNNILLLQLAELSHRIIKIETSKRDSLKKESGLKSLYHNEIVSLGIDATNKCIFTTNQHLFMPVDGSHTSDKVGKTFKEVNVTVILASYLFKPTDAGKNVR